MSRDNTLSGPVAPVEPVRRELHGRSWLDEYAWTRDHSSPRFLAYLEAERAFYDRATEHLAPLSDSLFSEVEQRVLQTDESVSWTRGAFFYYTRTVTGSEYEQFMSTRDPSVPGSVLLDLADFTGSDGFAEIGVREVSPDNRLLAYSVDTTGDEVYTLRFRDTGTGVDRPDVIPRSYYGGAWSADSTTFFYTVHDELYRPYQVWRHRVGTPVEDDVCVYTEDDPRYEVTVRATTSQAYVCLESACRDTTEVWLIPAASPDAAPVVVAPRRKGVEYAVDHSLDPDELYVVTNDGAPEFRLLRTSGPQWTEVYPARPGERLHACRVLAGHLILELRRDGFPLLRVVDRATGAEHEVHANIPAGTLTIATPLEYDARSVTVAVESLVEPPAWSDVDLVSGAWTRRKRRVVPHYDASAYRTRRHHVPAGDGTPIPVTLAWRADTRLDGTAACLLWGYGAYESCDDPAYDPMLASLLDRGVVYALTHPRGGGENGRAWWRGGCLEHKANTFTDHLAVADGLAAEGLVDGARLATRGLSAGGLLQGAVYSMRPERWRAVVAEVPFVDVVNTMLDPEIPLTVNEYDEWGDPRQPEAFAWLWAYSPYEQVPRGRRPALLVTGALHDPRVMVHEPAKWVARLRATAGPDDGPVLFRVELGAGAHTGPAGRYAHLRYEAEVLAFVLSAVDGA